MDPEMCPKSIPKWIPESIPKLDLNGPPIWSQNGRREKRRGKPREKKMKKIMAQFAYFKGEYFFTFFSRGFSRRPFWYHFGTPLWRSFGDHLGIHFGIDFWHISGFIFGPQKEPFCVLIWRVVRPSF